MCIYVMRYRLDVAVSSFCDKYLVEKVFSGYPPYHPQRGLRWNERGWKRGLVQNQSPNKNSAQSHDHGNANREGGAVVSGGSVSATV